MKRKIVAGVVAAGLAVAGYGFWRFDQNKAQLAAQDQASRADAPIVVSKALAAWGKIPSVVTAVGSASANALSVVKPRVDGMLLAYKAAEGSMVKAGQVIALLDPSAYDAALAQARGALQRDEAQWESAKVDSERYRRLVEKQAAPKQQLDTQEATAKQLAGAVAADRGSLASAELNRSWAEVRAPISGRFGIRAADPGNIVRSTDPAGLGSISAVDSMGAVFSIPSDSARSIAPGSKVLAFERFGGRLIGQGKVAALDNQIDAGTGTLKARAVFADGAKFISNEFLQIKAYGRETQGVVIPAACLALGSSGAFVWRIDPATMQARPAPVKIIAQNDESAVVEGVSAGQALAADSLDKLRDGSKVKFAEPDPPASPSPAEGAR